MPRPIEEQVRKTYFTLRVAAAVIAFAFPIILYAGGRILGGFGLRDSMSAYYHATADSLAANETPCKDLTPEQEKAIPEAGTMRNEFVGLLFAIGVILYVNKGHTDHENILLNIAGVLAWTIALFPMPWRCKLPYPINVHGTAAIGFFICIAIVSIVCSKDTVKYLPKEKQASFLMAYRVLGGLMAASPIFAYLANESILGRKSFAFAIEVFGIYAFAGYWIVKTREIAEIQKERKKAKIVGVESSAYNAEAAQVV